MSVRYPKEVFDIQRATNSVLSRISMLDSKNKYQMQLSFGRRYSNLCGSSLAEETSPPCNQGRIPIGVLNEEKVDVDRIRLQRYKIRCR